MNYVMKRKWGKILENLPLPFGKIEPKWQNSAKMLKDLAEMLRTIGL